VNRDCTLRVDGKATKDLPFRRSSSWEMRLHTAWASWRGAWLRLTRCWA